VRANEAPESEAAALLSLQDVSEKARGKEMDIVALDDSLQRLAEIDPRQSRIVEMRFFG
jgi:hypothetical protein